MWWLACGCGPPHLQADMQVRPQPQAIHHSYPSQLSEFPTACIQIVYRSIKQQTDVLHNGCVTVPCLSDNCYFLQYMLKQESLQEQML